MDSHTKEPESNNQYVFYPLKDMMICVDYSRRKIKFKATTVKKFNLQRYTSLSK